MIDNECLSNKYVSSCMRSVSLINENGTEIDTRWKKEYEVPVDRCKNETFTLNYKFVSSKNSEGKKLEKVIEVPWDPNCLESKEDQTVSTTTILVSAISAGLVFAIISLTIGILCYKRRNEIVKTDYNDIYGTYARGWDGEGDYGDGDQMEMKDYNPVYGT